MAVPRAAKREHSSNLPLLPSFFSVSASSSSTPPPLASQMRSVESQATNLGPQGGRMATSFLASSSAPAATDDAQKGNNNNGTNASGLVNYYFVFIALILCVVALAVFLVMRRKHRAVLRQRQGRERALQRDLSEALDARRWELDRRQRWYRQGRWRSAEASREEGLNEHGEAPPPYVPKRPSEEARRNANGETEEDGQELGDHEGPAIPLQTLSREDAGLKPPDYSESSVEDQNPHGRSSVASASSSRTPDTRPGP